MNLRRGHKIVVSVFVVLSTFFYIILPMQKPSTPTAQADWFSGDKHWKYRQKITISNSGGALVNYQFPLDEAMIARWSFENGGSTTVPDSSGYGHDGTITGLGESDVYWTVGGKYNNALGFSGVNTSFVDAGNSDMLNSTSGSITLSAWVKTSNTNQMAIVNKGFDTSAYSKGYSLEMNNGDVNFAVGGESLANSVYFGSTGTSYADNAWHLVAVVYDAASSRGYIYVDGVAQDLAKAANSCGSITDTEIDFSACTSASLTNVNKNLYLGRYVNSTSLPFNGVIDEVRIYGRAFTADDASYVSDNNYSPLLRGHLYGNAQDDGDDLRITTSDETTNIPYYKELFSGSGQNAKIWLRIPSIAASGNTDIYVYYGHATASSESAYSSVFDYIDNFNDGVIGPDWYMLDGNGSITEGSNLLNFSYDGTDTDWDSSAREVKALEYSSIPSYDFWAEVKILSYTVPDKTLAGMAVYQNDTNAYLFGRAKDGSTNNFSYDKLSGGAYTTFDQSALPAYLAIRRLGSSYTFWISHDDISWFQLGTSRSDVTFTNLVLFGKSYDGNALDFSFDDFLLRRDTSGILRASANGTWQPSDVSPTLTLTVEGTNSGESHNGVISNVDTEFNRIDFGSLKINEPKIGTQKITVTMNAYEGYTVSVKMDGYMQGLYPANKIDPFGATDASWLTPQTWSSPDGTEQNTDTGWFGANISDDRVSGWSNSSGKFGPISSTAHTIMNGADMDSGATKYISYKIETNTFQPADAYAGTLIYSVLPIY